LLTPPDRNRKIFGILSGTGKYFGSWICRGRPNPVAGTRLLAPFRLSVVSMLANLVIEASRFEATAKKLDASTVADPKAH
jgi:hypothetical protein